MKVVVKEEVYDDLISVVKWYENQTENLGVDFLDEWEQALIFIADNPFSFQVKFKKFRHSKINRFPYLIIFEIENSEVIVYSVIHSHRKTTRRYRRKK